MQLGRGDIQLSNNINLKLVKRDNEVRLEKRVEYIYIKQVLLEEAHKKIFIL